MITLKQLKEKTQFDTWAINEIVQDLFYSIGMPFRIRTHIIILNPDLIKYTMPWDIDYFISWTLNGEKIKADFRAAGNGCIELKEFPKEKAILQCDYYTTSICVSIDGVERSSFKADDDTLLLPEHLEGVFLNYIESVCHNKNAIKTFLKYAGANI